MMIEIFLLSQYFDSREQISDFNCLTKELNWLKAEICHKVDQGS